ncbi:RNA-binding protein 5 [Orchesella cincta]|uniref:RNA-binding protein 5 n=1 Tax=Orchesella cincta TaxID=48709 RepID=A0A1D2MI88_ORCCI|nr:RNA-binding protein 5 [Orchesella cincta]
MDRGWDERRFGSSRSEPRMYEEDRIRRSRSRNSNDDEPPRHGQWVRRESEEPSRHGQWEWGRRKKEESYDYPPRETLVEERRSSYGRGRDDDHRIHHSGSPVSDESRSVEYRYQEPSNVIMVHGLALRSTENDFQVWSKLRIQFQIRNELLKDGFVVKDIRVVRKHDESRRYAFVEFHTVAEAVKWMDLRKGQLCLKDSPRAKLSYCKTLPDSSRDASSTVLTDWICQKCETKNFKLREQCSKCHSHRAPRKDSAQPNVTASHAASTITIILKNVHPLTTEERVFHSLRSRADLSTIPIERVEIARDSATGQSTGFCYVEVSKLSDGIQLYGALSQQPLEVDGLFAIVSNTKQLEDSAKLLKTSKAEGAVAIAAAEWSKSTLGDTEASLTEDEIKRMARYYASTHAKNSNDYIVYYDHYRELLEQKQESGNAIMNVVKEQEFSSNSSQEVENERENDAVRLSNQDGHDDSEDSAEKEIPPLPYHYLPFDKKPLQLGPYTYLRYLKQSDSS